MAGQEYERLLIVYFRISRENEGKSHTLSSQLRYGPSKVR